MKKSLHLFFILFASNFILAQTPQWHWAKSVGGTYDDKIFSITVGKDGSLYITGSFVGVVDFDPDTGIFNLPQASITSGSDDIFICKYDSSGQLAWAHALGNIEFDRGTSVILDDSDNVIFAGIYKRSIDCDPGPGVFSLDSTTSQSHYICKWSSSGNLVWAKSYGFNIGNYNTPLLAQDDSGNIFLCGGFMGSGDFDPGPGVSNLSSNGDNDIYFLKLNSNGDLIWAKSLGGPSSEVIRSIGVDRNGNLYSTGIFSDSLDFDPGSLNFNLTSNGGNDIFILKLNLNGDFVWVKQIGNASFNDEVQSLKLDSVANIYLTGFFFLVLDFDPNAGVYNLTSNSSSVDAFVEKLDSSGNFDWAKRIGNNYEERGYALTLDNNSNVYLTGVFRGTVDFDPGPGVYNLTSLANNGNIFIWSLNSAGVFRGADVITGNDYDEGLTIDVDGQQNVYFAGGFHSPSLYAGSDTLISNGSQDIVFGKLRFDVTSGINNVVNKNPFYVYPNPSSGLIRIRQLASNNDKGEIIIVDDCGKLIYRSFIYQNEMILNIEKFGSGIYYISIRNSESVETKCIVIE